MRWLLVIVLLGAGCFVAYKVLSPPIVTAKELPILKAQEPVSAAAAARPPKPLAKLTAEELHEALGEVATEHFKELLNAGKSKEIAAIQAAAVQSTELQAYPSVRSSILALFATFTNSRQEAALNQAKYDRDKNDATRSPLGSAEMNQKYKEMRLENIKKTGDLNQQAFQKRTAQQIATIGKLCSGVPGFALTERDGLFRALREFLVPSKDTRKLRVMAQIENTELIGDVTVQQIVPGGAIMVGFVGKNKKGEYEAVPDRFFLAGLDTVALIDGVRIEGAKIYLAGTYAYTTTSGAMRTILRYATTPEMAMRLLARDVEKRGASASEE